MAEYASNAVGTGGLTTGIIGTALGVLNGGLGLLGNNGINSNYVTKDEMKFIQDLAAKDSDIALLKAEQDSETKMIEVYEKIMTRLNSDYKEQQAWNTSQSVANAQMSSAIATNANSISALNDVVSGITKTVVPITSVCPQPMQLYNSWTAPTTTTT